MQYTLDSYYRVLDARNKFSFPVQFKFKLPKDNVIEDIDPKSLLNINLYGDCRTIYGDLQPFKCTKVNFIFTR